MVRRQLFLLLLATWPLACAAQDIARMEGEYRWLPPLGPAVEKWQVRHHDWGSEYRSDVVHAGWRLEIQQRADAAGRLLWASLRRSAGTKTLSATYDVQEGHLVQVVTGGEEIRRAYITIPRHFSFAAPAVSTAGLHIVCYDYGRKGRHQHPVFWVNPETLEGQLITAWFEFVTYEETQAAGATYNSKYFTFSFSFADVTQSSASQLWIDDEGVPMRVVALSPEGHFKNTHVLTQYKRFTR